MTGRVDAHQHVWDLAVRAQPWTEAFPALQRTFSLDDLRAEQSAAGVVGTVGADERDLVGFGTATAWYGLRSDDERGEL